MSMTLHNGAVPQFVISAAGRASEQSVEGTAAFPTSAWVHVAVTLEGKTLTLYRNGEYENSGSISPSPGILSLSHNYLGRSAYPEDPFFHGRIDEVRFYKRALSAVEIQELAAGHFDEPDMDNDGIEDAWEIQVRFDSSVARQYQLIATTNLIHMECWEPVGVCVPGDDGLLSIGNAVNVPGLYYRVRAHRP